VFSRDFLEEEDEGEGITLSIKPVKEEEAGVEPYGAGALRGKH